MELTSAGWIDKNQYAEIENIYNKRNTIIDELKKILDKNIWPIYNNYKIVDKLMSSNDYTQQEKNRIYSINDASWRLFILLGEKNGKFYTTPFCNDEVKQTIEIIKNSCSTLRGAAFSLFEPGYKIDLHTDMNGEKEVEYYRVHIPLLIPKSNNDYKNEIISTNEINNKLAIFQLENDYCVWKDDNWFIWNPNYYHSAWNNTDELRVILIIDFYKE